VVPDRSSRPLRFPVALPVGAALAVALAAAGALVAPPARAASGPGEAAADASTAESAPDPLDRLLSALGAFRGLGDPDVTSYRVPVRLPEEEEESPPLVEIWRAPDDLALRAESSATPQAVVRSLAMYLEPVYVARSAFLRADLAEAASRVRTEAEVTGTPGADGGLVVTVRIPPGAAERMPESLRDVARLEAGLRADGRLGTLEASIRGAAPDGGIGTLALACTWSDDPADPQPARIAWTLPDGREVGVRTTCRTEDGRRVPAGRRVVFPSRWDPGETEEIVVEYGRWEIDPPLDDALLRGPGAFRYDANGLVEDDGA
jgi:hypothetical protein